MPSSNTRDTIKLSTLHQEDYKSDVEQDNKTSVEILSLALKLALSKPPNDQIYRTKELKAQDSTDVYKAVLKVYFNIQDGSVFDDEMYHNVLRAVIQGKNTDPYKSLEISNFERETLKFLAELTIYCCEDFSNPEAWLQELYPDTTGAELIECVFNDFSISNNTKNPKFIELRSYGLAILDLPEGPTEKEIKELHGPFTILRNGKLVYLPRRVITEKSDEVLLNDNDANNDHQNLVEITEKQPKKSSNLKFIDERPLTSQDLAEAHYQNLKRLDEIIGQSFAVEMKEVYDLVLDPEFQKQTESLIQNLSYEYMGDIVKMYPHAKGEDEEQYYKQVENYRKRLNEISVFLSYRVRYPELKNLHALTGTCTLLYGIAHIFSIITYLFQKSLKLDGNSNLVRDFIPEKLIKLTNKLDNFNTQNTFPALIKEDIIAFLKNNFSVPQNHKFREKPVDEIIKIPLKLGKNDIGDIKRMSAIAHQKDFLTIPFKCNFIRNSFNGIFNMGIAINQSGNVDHSYSKASVKIPDIVNTSKLLPLIHYLRSVKNNVVVEGSESGVDSAIKSLENYLRNKNSDDLKNGILYVLKFCSEQSNLIKEYAGEFKPIANNRLTIDLLSTFKINID